MTTNASRAPVDFDALARDLQQAPAPAQGAPIAAQPAGHKADPLAELARIVGQDDPFRALLEARDARAPAAGQSLAGRIEPRFHDEAAEPYAEPGAHAQAHGQAHSRTHAQTYAQTHPHAGQSPADAFDQYLASVERGAYPGAAEDGQGGHQGAHDDHVSRDFAPAGDHPRPADRPRHRSRLVSVGAGLAVVAVAVTGALTWRSLHSGGTTGAVPTILADVAPMKIAPKTVDGVEIPDQNKQIYDRGAKDQQIRVVNREEQPIDVAQAARSAQRESGAVTPGWATPGAPGQGPASGALTESLGEPRRVRTVSVKPDTPPPPPQRDVDAATATPSVIPTMTMPGADSNGGQAAASLRTRPGRAPAPVEVAAPIPPVAPQAEPTPAATARAKAPQRVAAITPDSTAALPEPQPKAASVGGFSVQLGVRGTEGEAKAAFKQMQGKYAQLSGQPALIRQAEVNGKTIYRVRVGPIGKAEATSLCAELQGAGGQCFVAKN